MAENPKTNTGILAKAQKRLSRTKTKVLQNLGKAEKTKDETFNTNVTQIEDLQDTTHPLHKELNNYLHCVKSLSQASKRLHNSLQSVYEDEWDGKSAFTEQMQTFDLLWNDYLQNFQDSVISPMNSFLQHFPAFKSKISKRGRKLVDFDNTRHHLEVLKSAKKKDEAKIEKADEDMKEAQRIYEEMNNELLAEMPAFYKSRTHFFSTLFTSLFGVEYVFHSEVGKVNALLGDTCQKLANQSEPMNLQINTSMSVHSENGSKWESSSGPSTPVASSPSLSSPSKVSVTQDPFYTNQTNLEEKQAKKNLSTVKHVNGDGVDDDDDDDDDDVDSDDSNSDSENAAKPTECPTLPARVVNSGNGASKEKEDNNDYVYEDEHKDNRDDGDDKEKESVSNADKKKEDEGPVYEEPVEPLSLASPTTNVGAGEEKGKKGKEEEDEGVEEDSDEDDNDDDDEDKEGNVYSQMPSNRPVYTPPPGTLYQVQATHKYAGEDVDELNFEMGEIIYVIQFDNPEEQDDGWQMGIKQSDGVKGVFPENFTKKI